MLTSKEFNEKLQINNFEMLEDEFQIAKKDLGNSEEELEVNEIKSKYPIYFEYNDLLMIKFPTYKVIIINNKKTEEELKNTLKEYGEICIYPENNCILVPSGKTVQSTAILCLGSNLEENNKMANDIISNLKNENIESEKWVASGRYPFSIKYTNEEKSHFKVLKKGNGYEDNIIK